jgi:hypothetical protein
VEYGGIWVMERPLEGLVEEVVFELDLNVRKSQPQDDLKPEVTYM